METLIKNLTSGSAIYALIKGDTLVYAEGTIESIGSPRADYQKDMNGQFIPSQTISMVMDVTYKINDKTYTDQVDANASMFPTKKPGAITLVSSDVEPIIRELKATLKKSEDYIKETETGIPNNTKRIEQCKELIAKLDTSFAEKKALEDRIHRLELQSNETNTLLKQLIEQTKK